MEFVNVAGTAITIHHKILTRNSLPFPLTKLLTIAPSMAATLTLIRVRTTRKKLWLINNRASLLLHPGITILINLISERKNSRFSSTFFLFFLPDFSSPPSSRATVASCSRWAAARCEAAFCSEMAWRMRLIRARKRVM
jgi:hypothetical protein